MAKLGSLNYLYSPVFFVPLGDGVSRWFSIQSQPFSQCERICSSTCSTLISRRAWPSSGCEYTMLCRAALARERASRLQPVASGIFPVLTSCSICTSKGTQPDLRMAMQLSCELDIANKTRDISSRSLEASIDNSQNIISTYSGNDSIFSATMLYFF